MTSAPAIGFEYRASRAIPWLFATMTALAAGALLLCGAPPLARAVALLATVAGCIRAIGRLRLPVSAVGWAGHGGWTVRGLDGQDDAAELKSFRVLHQLVLLHLISRRYGKLTFWLVPDNSDADIRRRLRMRLAVRRDDVQAP